MQSKAAGRAASKQAAAADRATEAQVQAGRESNAMNWAMYQQQLANQQPYMRGGQLAYSAMMGGMGLGPATSQIGAGGAGVPASSPDGTAATTQVVGQPGTPGFSTYLNGIGDVQTQNYGATNDEAANAASQYSGMFNHQFNEQDLKNNLDPGYAFRQKMAMKAIENSAAARGLTGSGQNLVDIANYNQDAASQEYSNAFNRYKQNQGDMWNRLASLAGTGQSSTQQVGNAGTSLGQTVGNTTTQTANAASNFATSGAASRAAGSVGSANAWGGALGNVGNAIGTYNGMQMMQNMQNMQQYPGMSGNGWSGYTYNNPASVGPQMP